MLKILLVQTQLNPIKKKGPYQTHQSMKTQAKAMSRVGWDWVRWVSMLNAHS